MFLNCLLNTTKNWYWSTKLKWTKLIWILRKARHLIELFKLSIIIYTNHDAVFEIVKQTTFITFFIDKFYLCLIKTSNYIQRFSLIIRYKFDKLHIVFDASFKFFFSLNTSSTFFKKEFDVLFTISMIEISNNFKDKMITNYKNDSSWK